MIQHPFLERKTTNPLAQYPFLGGNDTNTLARHPILGCKDTNTLARNPILAGKSVNPLARRRFPIKGGTPFGAGGFPERSVVKPVGSGCCDGFSRNAWLPIEGGTYGEANRSEEAARYPDLVAGEVPWAIAVWYPEYFG